MRVTRQVSQYLFWPTERLLGVDNPVGLDPRPQERGERLAVGEAGVFAEEPQLAALCAIRRLDSISPRNNAERTSTGRKYLGWQAIHLDPSGERPPPGTIMCGERV